MTENQSQRLQPYKFSFVAQAEKDLEELSELIRRDFQGKKRGIEFEK